MSRGRFFSVAEHVGRVPEVIPKAVDNSVDKSVFQHFSVFFFVDNCKELYTDTLFFFAFCKFMYISLSIMHNFQPFLIEKSVFNRFLKVFFIIRHFT